jgi:putative integrase
MLDARPEAAGISTAVTEQHGRILRAQRDYDEEANGGWDLKRIREAAEARIAELEAERLFHGRGDVLTPILWTSAPAVVFREASLEVQRHCGHRRLQPQPRGRSGFAPESVEISWR